MQNKKTEQGLAAFFGLLISGLMEDIFGSRSSTGEIAAMHCEPEECVELELKEADLLDEFLDSGLF